MKGLIFIKLVDEKNVDKESMKIAVKILFHYLKFKSKIIFVL